MKDRKRVCFFRSNPVNPDSRVEKEIMALYDDGYLVDVFCWDRESNHKIDKYSFGNTTINIYRVGYKAGFGEGVKSLKSFLKFQLSLVKWVFNHRNDYDIYHACDFDTAFFSFFSIRICKKKIVFDIFDFICGDSQNFFQKMVKKSQFFLINHADATIICTEKRKLQIKGTRPRKLSIIHNSPDGTIISNHIFDKQSKRKSVVYVGVFLEHRLLREMISYFEKNSDIDLYIGGFGLLEKFITESAEKHTNIHFMGKLPYNMTLALEQSCDIMTAIYDPEVENHRFAAPNKFYESLFLGKPLLMVKGTGMSEVVEKERIGAVIDYSEEGFAAGIQKLLDMEDEWDEMSLRMKKLYLQKYNWDVMKKRLIHLYEELD